MNPTYALLKWHPGGAHVSDVDFSVLVRTWMLLEGVVSGHTQVSLETGVAADAIVLGTVVVHS